MKLLPGILTVLGSIGFVMMAYGFMAADLLIEAERDPNLKASLVSMGIVGLIALGICLITGIVIYG